MSGADVPVEISSATGSGGDVSCVIGNSHLTSGRSSLESAHEAPLVPIVAGGFLENDRARACADCECADKREFHSGISSARNVCIRTAVLIEDILFDQGCDRIFDFDPGLFFFLRSYG